MRAVVLADDLTGAADTGLSFVRHGHSARVLLAAGAFENPIDCDLLIASTETRNLPEDAARAIVGEWAKRLSRSLLPTPAAPPLLYKKIDSTLRGWVGAEIGTLLDELPGYAAWIVPAYPEQGRRMRGGVYTVHDTPLHRTEFARDVRECSGDSFVPALLERQMREGIAFLDESTLAGGPNAIRERTECARRDGLRAVVFDTATEEQIDQIVAAGRLVDFPILWAGSAGLAKAVARSPEMSPEWPPPPPLWGAEGAGSAPIFIVAGSRNPATQRQIVFLKERIADLDHRTLLEDRASEETGGHILLTVPSADAGCDPLALASALGEAAAGLIRRRNARRLVLTGGDTAAATLRHLGADSLEILGAVEEGIPLLRVAGGPAHGALVVTKAGGFGAPSALYAAFALLAARKEFA